MPVYVFRCTNCGIEFDRLLSFSDKMPVRCPECRKNTLKKVFQPVGIVFKGSGFYATDHHSPSGQSKQKAEEKAERSGAESKSGESKSADSKPAESKQAESKPAESTPKE